MRQAIPGELAHRFLTGRGGIGDDDLLAALVADNARQRAGIYAPDRRDAVLLKHLVQGFRIPEIRRRVVILAHDHTADGRVLRFVILIGHTVVSDERIGHHDHLIRVGGI